MTEQPTPATDEWLAAVFDMAGTVAQLVASGASREQREIDHGDYLRAAMGIVASAYELVKLGGEDAVRAYADHLHSHADAVEQSVAGI